MRVIANKLSKAADRVEHESGRSDWARTHLGNIGVWGSGGTPSRTDKKCYGGTIPWIKIGDLSDGPVVVAEETITEHGLTRSAAKLLEPGTLLVAMYGSIGKLGITTVRCATNQAIAFCKPHPAFDLRYVFYLLMSERHRLVDQGQGGTQRNISQTILRSHDVPIAPLREQTRIVSKIDELFSRIDEGERALERAQRLVERYRQSVLKAAVTGELTREWRAKHKDKLESGEALLARILKARRAAWEKAELDKMKAKGQKPTHDNWRRKYPEPLRPDTSRLPKLPEGWVWVTFEHIAECLDFAREPVSAKVRASRQGTIPYYGANGKVGTIDTHLFDEPLVLVVEDETFTGRTKPFSYKIEGRSWVNNHAHVLRPTAETDIGFLNTALMQYPFIPLTTGTTARRKLTQKALMSAPIAVPSKSEQAEIVSALSGTLSSMESTQRDSLCVSTTSKALRRAILSSAFSGQLVPQEPADEPASVLLKRIADDRTATATAATMQRNRKLKQPA